VHPHVRDPRATWCQPGELCFPAPGDQGRQQGRPVVGGNPIGAYGREFADVKCFGHDVEAPGRATPGRACAPARLDDEFHATALDRNEVGALLGRRRSRHPGQRSQGLQARGDLVGVARRPGSTSAISAELTPIV